MAGLLSQALGICTCSKSVKMHALAHETFEVLELKHTEIDKLKKAFRQADRDRSGEVALGEFIKFARVEHTKFAERAFSVMDFDQSGCMDFEEFVVATWNFATLTDEGISRFAFHLYDIDESGTLSISEIRHMFIEVCGEEFAGSDRAQLLYQRVELMARSQNQAGAVTPVVFDEFVQKNAGLLLPANHMQLQLRRVIVTPKFWLRLQERRLSRFGGLKDNGWAEIERQLDEDFAERRKAENYRPPRRKMATTKTTRVLMAKREELMTKNAAKKRPALAAPSGSQSDYMSVFKKEKRERLHVHEQLEFTLRDLAPTAVPANFLANTEWTQLRRRLPLAQERVADIQFHDKLKSYESDIKDIRRRYPRGQDSDSAHREFLEKEGLELH